MAPCGERRPGGLAVRAAGVPAGWPTLPLSRAPRSSAVDSRTGAKVAIKKLYRPFQSELFAKRAYRELRLLKHMRHENVSALGRRWTPRPGASPLPLPAPLQSLAARQAVPPTRPLSHPPAGTASPALVLSSRASPRKRLSTHRSFFPATSDPAAQALVRGWLPAPEGMVQVSPQIMWSCSPGRGT